MFNDSSQSTDSVLVSDLKTIQSKLTTLTLKQRNSSDFHTETKSVLEKIQSETSNQSDGVETIPTKKLKKQFDGVRIN